MAQAVRHDNHELKSLLSHAEREAPIQKQQGGVFTPAGKLKYDEPKGWTITPRFAALMGSHKVGVQGECSAEKLGQLYFQGYFDVLLGTCNIDDVELKLTLPDGSVKSSTESLQTYPVNKRFLLKVGAEFFNMFESGNIKFELNGTDGSPTLKKGLVIYGVTIKQIVDPTPNAFTVMATGMKNTR